MAAKLAGYWDVAMQAPDGKYANFNNMGEDTFEGLYSAGRAHEGGPNAAVCALVERLAADADARGGGVGGDRLLLWAADNGGGPYYFRGTSPFWFLWRRDAAPAPREKPALPDAMLFRTAGHTIWTSPDVWLAYNAGWTSDKSHNNRDLGSFVLVYRGERFVADPGYGHVDAANHSTIVIDGGDQVRGKGGKYLGWLDGGADVKYLVSDLSGVYSQKLDRFERQLVLVGGTILVIVDDLAAAEPHEYEWRLQTRLTPDVGDASASLRGERAALHVVPLLPESMEIGTGKKHINYLSIKPKEKGDTTFVTVLYPDTAGSTPPKVSLERAGDRATLKVAGPSGNASLEFTTRDAWRLTSVNGRAVGEIKPPTERTFKAFR
jgi:hypothetical protein